MRISDWSSDVCSSDLVDRPVVDSLPLLAPDLLTDEAREHLRACHLSIQNEAEFTVIAFLHLGGTQPHRPGRGQDDAGTVFAHGAEADVAEQPEIGRAHV